MPDENHSLTLRPSLPEIALPLYEQFRKGLRRCRSQDRCQQDLASRLLHADLPADMSEPEQVAVRAFFEVMEDLMRHGWQFDAPDGEATLEAIAPDVTTGNGQDRQEVKRRQRHMLVEARNDQLRQPTVRRFVEKMERPCWHRGRQVSVQDLFADPQDFAADLERRLQAAPDLREGLLHDLVDPYLQHVTDARDEHTGLRLRDVWRYCRYTWSLPQKTQPGRRMAYLVRDAARPFHPVMGIGALGSSIVQITCRDEAIGWTLAALKEADDPAARMHALSEELDRAVAEVYRADFEEDGIFQNGDVQHPTPAVLERLGAVADAAPEEGTRIGRDMPLEEAARAPLYRYKRAGTLLDLLRARRTLQQTDADADPAAQLTALLSSSEGRRALKVALRSLKKRHVGSSMMNITTCGAIPPYNPVLGGKLAGLLMVSPQVVADYQEKYGGASSYIASRMQGAALERRNKLALLETTSLYGVGSSQYNRLRAPVDGGEVHYEKMGETDGYGSVHLSERTYRTLQQLLRAHPDLEEESNEFGRGVNYKIRSISAALNHLGLSRLQRHKNTRLVYAIPLAENWQEYLTGRDDAPRSLYEDLEQPLDETRALADFWKQRWFVKRVQKPMILRRLKALRGKVRVSDLASPPRAAPDPFRSAPDALNSSSSTNGKRFMPSEPKIHWTVLAELVGGRASFAERLSEDERAALHIRMKLDDGLLDAVRAGKRLYLTGNPGDGKAHLIERHETALREADILLNLEANAGEQAPFSLAA